MSDVVIANVARRLAAALMQRARSRNAEDTKLVALLDTELCQAVKDEAYEKNAAQDGAPQGV